MDVAVRLAVPVGLCRWRDSPSCYSPLVKMTFDLRASGWAVLSSEQEPITDGEIDRGLVTWPSDFGEAKGACEIAVVGAALHEHRTALRVRVGATTLEAQNARALGPIGRGGGRSYFAIEAARTSFPSLPLEIVIEGVGETIRCAIPVPPPDIALVMGRAWGEAQRVRPFIDQVLLDPIRRRCVLVFRGFFTHPGDADTEASLVVDALGKLEATAPREIARWPRMSAVSPDDFGPDERTPFPPAGAGMIADDAPTPDSDARPSIPIPRSDVEDDDGETTGEQPHRRGLLVEPTIDATVDGMETTSQLVRSPAAYLAGRPASATIPAAPPTEDVLEIDPNEAEELIDDESTSDPPVEDASTAEGVVPPAPRRGFDRTLPMPSRAPTPPIGIPFVREPAKVSATTRMPVFGPPPASRRPARTQQMTASDLPPELVAQPTFGPPPAPPPPLMPASPSLPVSPPSAVHAPTAPPPGPPPAPPAPDAKPAPTLMDTRPPPPPGDARSTEDVERERPRPPRFRDENESTQLFVLPTKPAGQVPTGLPFAPAPPGASPPPRRSFTAEERIGNGPITQPPAEGRDEPATIPPPADTPSERRTAPPPPMPSATGWGPPHPPTVPPAARSEAPPRASSTAPPPAPPPRKRSSFDADEHTAQIQIPVAPRAPLPFVDGSVRAPAPSGMTLGGSALGGDAAPRAPSTAPPGTLAPPELGLRNDDTELGGADRLTSLASEEPARASRGTIPPPAFTATPGAPEWLSASNVALPSSGVRLDELRAPPPVETSTIPLAPQWKPRAVEAPPKAAMVSDATSAITLEEYAALRAELWSGTRSRRDVLKSRGLSELRWRAIERKFAREIDSMSSDPSRLLPLLSRLESASR